MSKQQKHTKVESKAKEKSMNLENIKIRGEYIDNALDDLFDDDNE